jgi:thioesterase domain-containing protein
VPVGVSGELHLGGLGLARGYLNLPELTAEKFIPDPFSRNPAARLYRTGDLARYLPDGNIEFLGRLDEQVKIRGFRIEPGEIEATLALHPGIRQNAVVLREDTPGDKRLVAYLVPAGLKTSSPDEQLRSLINQLSSLLRAKLPSYLVPDTMVIVDSLPLTTNRKVDRRALAADARTTAGPRRRYVPPANPTEALLAQLWEELLGVQRIGTLDDFFELGGHSLLAVSMAARVEKMLGRKLPLAALFAEATIASVAHALLAATGAQADPPMLRLQAGNYPAFLVRKNARRPFFFMHGDYFGGGLYCRNLARQVGAERPFYVIQPHGLAGQQPLATIEAMAAAHLELLRAVQPEGPYLLGGYCNGALEAFEMARQLLANGQRVDLLALMAPPAPNSPFVSVVDVGFGRATGGVPSTQPGLDLDALGPNVARQALLRLCARACASYVPQFYPGRVTLFQPEEDVQLAGDASSGWKEVAAEIEIHVIRGGHETMVARHAHALGERLRTCLLKAIGG